MSKLLIKNAEIPGEQARVNLLIQDGIIESISNAKESQDQTDPNTKVIDAMAKYVCANRQLVATALNQHRKTDFSWATIVKNFVHGGAYGAAGAKYIIDEDHVSIFNAEGYV